MGASRSDKAIRSDEGVLQYKDFEAPDYTRNRWFGRLADFSESVFAPF
jgi:hypothetical protein